MDLTLRQIHHEFKNAHAALHATLPSTAVDTSFSSSVVSAKLLNYKGGWNSEEQFNDDEPGTPHSERVGTPGTGRRTARGVAGLSVDGSTSASASALNSARMEDSAASEDTKHSLGMVTGTEEGQLGDMQEIPDLAEAKYATQRFQLLKDLVTCMIGTEEVAEVAQKRLKEEHRVYVDNETGKILNHREIGNLQNQIVAKSLSKVTKSSHKQQAPSVPGVTGNASTANPGDADVASVAAGASLESKDAQQRATNAAPAITYKASKLSGGTLQSDLLPLVQTFGKDQASLWIEWALSKASSMSFGFLGQSCLDPLPDVGFDLKQKPAPTGPILDSHEDEFLLQVRQRLLDLEITLSNPGENSKVTSVRGVRLESRAINFLLLAKVTVQLKMKKEAGQCILQLEDVCAGLRRQQCDSLDSLVYHSFALRFRMDYEEWCVSAMVSDAWQLSYLVNKMLPLCKQYLAVCNKIGDAVLQRDALKRLINVYSEAGRIAVSDDSDVLLMTTERIQLLTSAELDSYETNIEWVQRNGVNRALLMYEELHKLGTSTRA